MTARASARRLVPRREVSAGGVVLRGDEVLLVKVENLEGRVVWTFPKGHLERGETSAQAALREVREETGWVCRLGRSLGAVRYRFRRDGRPVAKSVAWYLMEPAVKSGEADPDEILDCRWFAWKEAEELLLYGSDRRLLARLKRLRRAAGRKRR